MVMVMVDGGSMEGCLISGEAVRGGAWAKNLRFWVRVRAAFGDG